MAILSPVFVGWTEDKEKIILYQHVNHPEEIYIQLPNNEVLPLSPSAKIQLKFTWEIERVTDKTWVSIESPEWTGTAVGTRRDLIEADIRRERE